VAGGTADPSTDWWRWRDVIQTRSTRWGRFSSISS